MNRRGMTLIELLVAVLILGVSLAGLVGLWAFSFNTTAHSQDIGVAYSIARQEIERVRNIGFLWLPVKQQWVRGYDGLGNETPEANPHFTATTIMDPYLSEGSVITNTSLRVVRVQVRSRERPEWLFETESYLTLGGI